MKIDTFANRLQQALNDKEWKQVDLVEKTKLDKSLISNYLSGNYVAKQDKLSILSEALEVNEVWLLGYDVIKNNNLYKEVEESQKTYNNITAGSNFDEYAVLFNKFKDLSEYDKKLIIHIIETRKAEIDKELDGK